MLSDARVVLLFCVSVNNDYLDARGRKNFSQTVSRFDAPIIMNNHPEILYDAEMPSTLQCGPELHPDCCVWFTYCSSPLLQRFSCRFDKRSCSSGKRTDSARQAVSHPPRIRPTRRFLDPCYGHRDGTGSADNGTAATLERGGLSKIQCQHTSFRSAQFCV